jgi:hypothetical protein
MSVSVVVDTKHLPLKTAVPMLVMGEQDQAKLRGILEATSSLATVINLMRSRVNHELRSNDEHFGKLCRSNM